MCTLMQNDLHNDTKEVCVKRPISMKTVLHTDTCTPADAESLVEAHSQAHFHETHLNEQ